MSGVCFNVQLYEASSSDAADAVAELQLTAAVCTWPVTLPQAIMQTHLPVL